MQIKIDGRTRHGQHKTRLYQVWAVMKYRCYNPKHPQFKYWGGKGVRVARAWHDFIVFAEWANTHGYADNLLLDREDGEKDYGPDNCRWATPHESAVNRCSTKINQDQVNEIRRRAARGERQKDLAVEFNLGRSTISQIVCQKRWRDSQLTKLKHSPNR